MKMKSPDGKTIIECHPANVELRISRGWTEVSEKKPESKKKLTSDKD